MCNLNKLKKLNTKTNIIKYLKNTIKKKCYESDSIITEI